MADSPPPVAPPAPFDAGLDAATGAWHDPTGPEDNAAPVADTPVQALLRPAETGALGPVWDALADRAAHYATRARGAGTRRTYRSAWTHFSQWCRDLGREPLGGDPDLVAMYVVRRADDGLTVSSIRVALAAIRTAYQLAGVPLDLSQPRFRMTLEGVVRSRGVRPTRQAAPAVPDVLANMLAALPSPELAARHPQPRHAAARLRGGAAALRAGRPGIGDVQRVAGRGLTVLVRRSKTDQHGRGQQVAIWANPADPLACPAAALERWLALRDTAPDAARCFGPEARAALPLFCGMSKAGRLSGIALSDKAVARLVKTAAAAAGLDPENYSGHSLRAGPGHRRRRPGRRPCRPHAANPAQIHRGRPRLPPPRRPLAQQRHRRAAAAQRPAAMNVALAGMHPPPWLPRMADRGVPRSQSPPQRLPCG